MRRRRRCAVEIVVVVERQVHRAGAARRQIDGDVRRSRAAVCQRVDEDVVARVHARDRGSRYHVGGRDRRRRAGDRARHVDAVVVNLVARAARDADAGGGEGRAVETARRGVEGDVLDEVVADDVIRAAREVDAVRHPEVGRVVFRTVDLIALDRERTGRADAADINRTVGRTRAAGEKTFDVNGVAGNRAVGRALRRDADRIDLVNCAGCGITDQVIADRQTRKDCGRATLHGDAASAGRDAVIVNQQIRGGSSRTNRRRDCSNRRWRGRRADS